MGEGRPGQTNRLGSLLGPGTRLPMGHDARGSQHGELWDTAPPLSLHTPQGNHSWLLGVCAAPGVSLRCRVSLEGSPPSSAHPFPARPKGPAWEYGRLGTGSDILGQSSALILGTL